MLMGESRFLSWARDIREEYTNSHFLFDRLIYQHIRYHQSKNDEAGARKRLAYLSDSIQRDFFRLQDDDWMTASFSELLSFTGTPTIWSSKSPVCSPETLPLVVIVLIVHLPLSGNLSLPPNTFVIYGPTQSARKRS